MTASGRMLSRYYPIIPWVITNTRVQFQQYNPVQYMHCQLPYSKSSYLFMAQMEKCVNKYRVKRTTKKVETRKMQSCMNTKCMDGDTSPERMHGRGNRYGHRWRIVKTPGGAFRLVTVQFIA